MWVVFHALFDDIGIGIEQNQDGIGRHVVFPRLGVFDGAGEIWVIIALAVDHFFDVETGENDVFVFVDEAYMVGNLKALKSFHNGLWHFGHGFLVGRVFDGLLIGHRKVIVHVVANAAFHTPLLKGCCKGAFATVFGANDDDAHI